MTPYLVLDDLQKLHQHKVQNTLGNVAVAVCGMAPIGKGQAHTTECCGHFRGKAHGFDRKIC